MKKEKSPTGFTLIEALLAIFVFMVGVAAILQIFPLSLNLNSVNEKQTQAVFLAQAKIEEIKSQSYWGIAVGVLNEAKLASPFDKFSRKTTVSFVTSDLTATTSDTGLKEIDVQVSWQSLLSLSGKKVVFKTLIARK
ncbi:MAG: prepilin-type N-terminal cleavage/methylation domain-containing protein [Patescibacteria group bacterium]|nr:prepilin-type N-terminal cleavage/methylation domain-containing protein [Patescibacteria group bacterium]